VSVPGCASHGDYDKSVLPNGLGQQRDHLVIGQVGQLGRDRPGGEGVLEHAGLLPTPDRAGNLFKV
jgi:hypothetical protein